MTTDDRMTWGLILEILDLLERHGYHKHDTKATGQAVGVIYHLTRVYEGGHDAPYSTHLDQAPPSPSAGPQRPGRQADPDAVILTGTDIGTVVSALYVAAEENCDRAETCADCADRSCPACQSRLQAAHVYDQLTARILQPAQAQPAQRDHPEPGSSSLSPHQTDHAAGIEAGQ
jgi:hypothetical protein